MALVAIEGDENVTDGVAVPLHEREEHPHVEQCGAPVVHLAIGRWSFGEDAHSRANGVTPLILVGGDQQALAPA